MIVDIDINPLSIDALDMDFEYLSFPKIVFGANPFKISDIQEDEAEGLLNQPIGMHQCYAGSKPVDGVFGMHSSRSDL